MPLTGREPLLGRLRQRLGTRAPANGFLFLAGPAGAGISRLLDEAAQLLSADGGPRPLQVRPVGPEAPKAELQEPRSEKSEHFPIDGQTSGDYAAIGTRVMVDF